MQKENKKIQNSDALKGFLLNFCHAHRYKNVGQALPDNKGCSCPPCGGSYKNVGQARPDNAPSKKHPSVLIMGKDTLCCQVKPDLHSRRGFTLIELLVVVLIIGILATVALPQYTKAVEKSRVTQALTFLNAVYKGYQLCVLQNGNDTKKCGVEDEENLATNNLLVNMDIQLPGEVQTGDNCFDGYLCVKTKDWSFESDGDPSSWGAYRVKNEKGMYSLVLQLSGSSAGKIFCFNGKDSFCSSLCGSSGCYLN